MRVTRTTGIWRRPTLTTLIWSLWFALLFGLPPVLTLPSALPADGIALSFSSARACMAFAMLVGRAFASGFPPLGPKSSRAVRIAGMVATLAYVSLLGFSFACELPVDAGIAVCLSFIGLLLSVFAAFSCSLALPSSCEGRPAEKPERVTLSVATFAVAAAVALFLSVGYEPCLTLARVSFTYSSPTAGSEWWRVLVYDLAGVVGPGSHSLRFGTADLATSQLFVACGWLAIGVLAAHSACQGALPGIAIGVLACRWMVSCLGFETSIAVPLGLVSTVLALAALAIDALRDRKSRPDAEGQASLLLVPDIRFSVLSSREREAVEGRVEGLSSSELAKRMGVQPSTVRNLQSRAASKLGVSSLDDLCNKKTDDTVGKYADSSAGAGGVSMPALLGVVLLVLVALLLTRALSDGAWIEQALLGSAIASFSLLFVAVGLPEKGFGAGDFPVSSAWALLALQLGLIAAVITNREQSMSTAGIVLALAFAGADLTLLLRHRSSHAWGADICGFAFFMGLGLLLGAWLSWPLSAGQGMFVVRDSASGLVAISAVAGFVFGAVLLLGLAAASYASFTCGVHEELKARRQEGKKGLESRAKAFYASRGMNGTQSDVAWCTLNGLSREQMGLELNLSLGAVNSAKRGAYRTLGVHSVAELIRTTLRAIN